MARCVLAGDWHGNIRWVASVLEWTHAQGIKYVFHAGDFGIWPGASGKLYLNSVIKMCEEYGIVLWVTPGNHEDYSQIEDPETTDGSVPDRQVLAGDADEDGWEVAILPRGYQWGFGGLSWVSFGGAPSIDYQDRQEGVSWWREEMIRESDLLRLPLGKGTDVMICHDAPDGGTDAVQRIIDTPWAKSMWTEEGLRYAREGRMLMNQAIDIVEPRMFVHGHFHAPDLKQDEETKRIYLSLGMDGDKTNVVIFDTDQFEKMIDGMGEVKEIDS